MKKIFLTLLIPFHIYGQNGPSNNNVITLMKTISNSERTTIKEEHAFLGSVGNKFRINVITLMDLDKHDTVSGIRFILSDKKSWGTSGYSSFAEADEIAGLVNFFDFIKTLPAPVMKSTEYTYSTSGNFRVSAFIDTGDAHWRYGVFIDKNHSDSFSELDSKEIMTTYQLIVSAKGKLGK